MRPGLVIEEAGWDLLRRVTSLSLLVRSIQALWGKNKERVTEKLPYPSLFGSILFLVWEELPPSSHFQNPAPTLLPVPCDLAGLTPAGWPHIGIYSSWQTQSQLLEDIETVPAFRWSSACLSQGHDSRVGGSHAFSHVVWKIRAAGLQWAERGLKIDSGGSSEREAALRCLVSG